MTIHVDPDRVTAISTDVAARARALAVNAAIYARCHAPELAAIMAETHDRTAIRAAAAVSSAFEASRDWDAALRHDVRTVTRALHRVAGRRGAVRERAAWLRERLLEIEAQDVRLRTLRELLGLIAPRRTLLPVQEPRRRR